MQGPSATPTRSTEVRPPTTVLVAEIPLLSAGAVSATKVSSSAHWGYWVTSPVEAFRLKTDRLLTDAGRVLQDRDAFDRNAALGIAVSAFPPLVGVCDYLLVVGGKAAGVIEAIKTHLSLTGVADQSEKYVLHPPKHLARWDEVLNYHCESTGYEIFFRNLRDPKGRSRRLNDKSLCSVPASACLGHDALIVEASGG